MNVLHLHVIVDNTSVTTELWVRIYKELNTQELTIVHLPQASWGECPVRALPIFSYSVRSYLSLIHVFNKLFHSLRCESSVQIVDYYGWRRWSKLSRGVRWATPLYLIINKRSNLISAEFICLSISYGNLLDCNFVINNNRIQNQKFSFRLKSKKMKKIVSYYFLL